MKLVIDRGTWYRGKGSDGSFLLLGSGPYAGCRCGLGELALACGARPEEIIDQCGPSDVPTIAWPDAFKPGPRSTDTPLVREITRVNDDEDMSDHARVERLLTLFWNGGVQIEFIGGGQCAS